MTKNSEPAHESSNSDGTGTVKEGNSEFSGKDRTKSYFLVTAVARLSNNILDFCFFWVIYK
jgi:hypothetical protein